MGLRVNKTELLKLFFFLSDLVQKSLAAKLDGSQRVSLFGFSSTGKTVYGFLRELGIPVAAVYDSACAGLKLADGNVVLSPDHPQAADGGLMLLCTTRPFEEMSAVVSRLESSGYTVIPLHTLIDMDDTVLFSKLFHNLPANLQAVIYRNASAEFWDIYGASYYDVLRYETGDMAEVECRNKSYREFIAAKLTAAGGKTYLEAGAGRGYTLESFLRKHPAAKAVGIDISHNMLSYAFNNLGLPLLNADLRSQLPFKSKSFDVSYSASAIQHVPLPFMDSVLSELIRITRKCIFHFEGGRTDTATLTAFDFAGYYRDQGYAVEEYDFYAEYPRIKNQSSGLQCLKVLL